jgi:hypothetical protein
LADSNTCTFRINCTSRLQKFRISKKNKSKVFDYSLKKYPNAKVFGITTGLAVMKINSELGYKPVPFSELTTDSFFGKDAKPVPIMKF